MYNFDKLVDRRGTDCIKWDRVAKVYGAEDVIPLWIADMDFEILPELQQALHTRVDHPSFGYTLPPAGYRESIVNWCRARHGMEITKSDIWGIPGVITALAFVLHALTIPGDKVMICTPVYNPFAETIEAFSRTLITSPLKCEGTRRVMDFEDIEAKMQDGVKMFILCNPHNPIGRVWTKEELHRLAELCAKYNVYLFSDEIHADLCYGGHKHCSVLTVSDKAREIAICAMAPSKTFNIAGLKSSMFIIQNPEIREKIKAAVNAFHLGLDLLAYTATEACYTHGAQWVDELNDYLFENARFVTDFCEKHLKVHTFVPEGTYLMWLDFSAYGLSQEELMRKLKEDARVGLNNGTDYGPEGLGFARMNIGSPRFLLEEALNRIKNAFEQ